MGAADRHYRSLILSRKNAAPCSRFHELCFDATIEHSGNGDRIYVREFAYSFTQGETAYRYGMKLKDEGAENGRGGYELIDEGYGLKRSRGRPWPLPPPVKCYGFPDQVNAAYQNAGFLNDLVLSFEQIVPRCLLSRPTARVSAPHVCVGRRAAAGRGAARGTGSSRPVGGPGPGHQVEIGAGEDHARQLMSELPSG